MRWLTTVCAIALLAVSPLWAQVAPALTLHVAPDGNDAWSGRLPEPDAGKTDGPLASLTGARDAVRALRAADAGAGPARVLIRSGTYRMAEPLVLEPRDSNVTYAARSREKPVLSGGRPITGWEPAAGGLWSVRLREVADGTWHFRQLFVNGQRRTRARSPNEGYFTVVSKAPPVVDPDTGTETARDQTAFIYAPGDIKPWPNPEEVNVVVYHSWETSRLRIAEVDEADHIVRFTGPACWPFERWGAGQRYYVENAPDALDAPGEWYLERESGLLTYYPLPGEDMREAEVIAPSLTRLVELRGDAELGLYVENVTFSGLSFQHQDWTLEPEGHSDPQAAVTIPAAVMADGALSCTVEGCEIAHVGEYAVWLRRGCRSNRIARNRIHDFGVGGVRIGEAVMARADAAESQGNLIDNNHIFDGGRVYPAGVGVWVAQSSQNTISHNEIHGLPYSGLSIGWNWNDAPNRCHHNTIEYNHVHHVMSGELNDGGGIYTLGTSPGSIIRNNIFHDIWPYSAIGWGIYLDATANQYLVENNIVYNTLSGGLMYHNGGHQHVIRNNVFAFSAQQMLWPYWEPRPNAFRRNIIYFTQGDLFIPFAEKELKDRLDAGDPLGEWDHNLYFNPNDPDFTFFRYPFPEWQALGLDQHSVIEDPQFLDAEGHDFGLKPTSAALRLGFEPIDTTKVGLHGDADWVREPRRIEYPPTKLPEPPPPPTPKPVDDGFETTVAGAVPDLATVSGEEKGASIRVTDEQAAAGRHSLRVIDAPGLEFTWQPHLFYQPHFLAGTVRQSFDLYLQPESLLFTEWRDNGPYPANIGPTVTFDGSGSITASGERLRDTPVGEWLHVEIECALGKAAPRTFRITIAVPGEPRQQFDDIPFTGEDFAELHWLGFVSTATGNAAFYLDNVRVQPLEP